MDEGVEVGHTNSLIFFIHCWLSVSDPPERIRLLLSPSMENAKW